MSHNFYITPEDYEAARQNGINEENLYQRVYIRLWSIERAISTPIRERNAHGWNEHSAAAIKNGVSYTTYRQRIKYLGWTQEKAATTPPLDNDKKAERARAENKRMYTLLTQENYRIAERNGISQSTAYQRVKIRGWDVETAISLPVMTNSESLQVARDSENSFQKTNQKYWLKQREG